MVDSSHLSGLPNRRALCNNSCVVAIPKSGNGKGVTSLEYVIAFGISVVAGIVVHYLCKWLDGEDSGNQH